MLREALPAASETQLSEVEYWVRVAERPPYARPPACPDCGRRFGVAERTGRMPLHGSVDQRCPGADQPPADDDLPPEHSGSAFPAALPVDLTAADR